MSDYIYHGKVLLQKRWLRPENTKILSALLLNHKIDILPERYKFKRRQSATYKEVIRLYLDPSVDIDWPIAIIESLGHWLDYAYESHTQILCAAFKRPNANADTLDRLYDLLCPLELRGLDLSCRINVRTVSKAAFDSGNREVILWALRQRFGPTNEQLKYVSGLVST
jgi:hypothetical protein